MENAMLSEFLDFCRRNLDHSFAQNFQDLFGLWAAGGKSDGYFVEFGVMSGRNFSNTYMLEKLGWQGIVSEPHPDFMKPILACRDCFYTPRCVFDTTGDTIQFRMVVGRPAMSGIGETQLDDDKADYRNKYNTVDVETVTLNDLLDEFEAPDVVDFISIDTEGSELRILNAFDFTRRRIRSFCIEHNFAQREALAALMKVNSYVRLFPALSAHDDWWILREELDGLGPLDLLVSKQFNEIFEIDLPRRRATLEAFAQQNRA
jgi:FkbM family methyltransferase